MAIPAGMAERLKRAVTGKAGDGAERATHCLDVWEWEGGAGGAAEIGIDPHATLREHPAARAGRAAPGRFRAWARAVRPAARWAGFALLGAGLIAISRRERARSH